MPGVPLLANMTEFGRTPFFTGARVRGDGLQDGDLAGQSACASPTRRRRSSTRRIKRDGGTQNMLDRMQTRAELYATIGYHDYEALDASIVDDRHPGVQLRKGDRLWGWSAMGDRDCLC